VKFWSHGVCVCCCWVGKFCLKMSLWTSFITLQHWNTDTHSKEGMNDLGGSVSAVYCNSTFQCCFTDKEMRHKILWWVGCWDLREKSRLLLNRLHAWWGLTQGMICRYGCEVILHFRSNQACSLYEFLPSLSRGLILVHVYNRNHLLLYICHHTNHISHKFLKAAGTGNENVLKPCYIFTVLHKAFENVWFSKSSMKMCHSSFHILAIGGFHNNSLCTVMGMWHFQFEKLFITTYQYFF
jgi:hypothetical protein